MKLSEFALTALKNFSTINDGIVLRPGSKIRTVNEDETVWGQAEVEDVFPVEFGIYDLSNFLGNISALDNPDVEFSNEKEVKLSDKDFTLIYKGHLPSLITSPAPNKKIGFENPEVVFDLSKDTLAKLLKLSAMNKLPFITLVGDESGNLRLQTHETNNPDSNLAYITVGTHSGEPFTTTFKVDLLKIILDDYVVELKKDVVAKFSSKNRKLEYFISPEVKKGKF